jgi:hypothetical protein
MTNGDEFSAESLRNQSAVKPAQSHLKDLSGIAEKIESRKTQPSRIIL